MGSTQFKLSIDENGIYEFKVAPHIAITICNSMVLICNNENKGKLSSDHVSESNRQLLGLIKKFPATINYSTEATVNKNSPFLIGKHLKKDSESEMNSFQITFKLRRPKSDRLKLKLCTKQITNLRRFSS